MTNPSASHLKVKLFLFVAVLLHINCSDYSYGENVIKLFTAVSYAFS